MVNIICIQITSAPTVQMKCLWNWSLPITWRSHCFGGIDFDVKNLPDQDQDTNACDRCIVQFGRKRHCLDETIDDFDHWQANKDVTRHLQCLWDDKLESRSNSDGVDVNPRLLPRLPVFVSWSRCSGLSRLPSRLQTWSAYEYLFSLLTVPVLLSV